MTRYLPILRRAGINTLRLLPPVRGGHPAGQRLLQLRPAPASADTCRTFPPHHGLSSCHFPPTRRLIRGPGTLSAGRAAVHMGPEVDVEAEADACNSKRPSEPSREGPGGAPRLTKRQRKDRGRSRTNPNRTIAMAAKFNDTRVAMEAFRSAQEPLGPQMYNTLLHLCSGGENWESVGRGGMAQPSIPEGYDSTDDPEPPQVMAGCTKDELLEASAEVEAAIRAKGLADNEILHTCRCRLAMLRGDAAESFALAKEAEAKGMARLRTYAPALFGFAMAGDMREALEVKAAVEAAGLLLTEAEYLWMLEGSISAKCVSSAFEVIKSMQTELVTVENKPLELLRAVFQSEWAASAFAAGGHLAGKGYTGWKVTSDCTVEEDGTCEVAGSKLQIVDLTPEEMEEFAEGIKKIAQERGRKEDFDNFIAWLEHNPREIMVDGANVALYGQNFEDGGFSFKQIVSVMEKVSEREAGRPQLLVLHSRRVKAPVARERANIALLDKLRQEKNLYTCQKGSNDDWYWLYATVKAGSRGLLVSNDEMRDHLFSLLAPKYFQRWKQHHQIKYQTGPFYTVLQYPPKYTTCIQELENGAWMFPAVDGSSWLCARPE